MTLRVAKDPSLNGRRHLLVDGTETTLCGRNAEDFKVRRDDLPNCRYCSDALARFEKEKRQEQAS